MPKGIYDRSKMKKKAQEAATTTPTKIPAKRGRKPKAFTATPATTTVTTVNSIPTPTAGMSDMMLIYEIRANLATLAQVAAQFNSISVQKELHANMELLSSLRESITKEYIARTTPAAEAETITSTSVKIQVPLPPTLQFTPPSPETH